MDEFRYCPRCATELELRPSSGPDPDRPTCPNCGFVHYDNPSPTAQGWIDRDGSFLALRRAGEPFAGRWNLPGGFVENDESGPEAVAREVLEETGFEIEVVRVIGVYASRYGTGDDATRIFDAAFQCRITGGEMNIAADESSEAEWFTLEDFPEPAFAGERAALAALRT